MKNRDVLDALAGRVLVYRVFQSLFGNPPSLQQLEVIAGETSLESMRLLGEGKIADGMVTEFAQQIENALNDVDAVQRAYGRLFVGPGSLPVPPWESVHVCGERLLLQESTLAVRKEYLDQGLLPAEYPHVADDHIALELDFMAALGDRAKTAYETGDAHRAFLDMKASKSFLTQHLRKWLPVFSEKLETGACDEPYVFAARILNELTWADESLLDRLIERVD